MGQPGQRYGDRSPQSGMAGRIGDNEPGVQRLARLGEPRQVGDTDKRRGAHEGHLLPCATDLCVNVGHRRLDPERLRQRPSLKRRGTNRDNKVTVGVQCTPTRRHGGVGRLAVPTVFRVPIV